MYYFKLCSVTRFNSETLSNETVYYVGMFQLMDGSTARFDQVIKKTPVCATIVEAKKQASVNNYGI